MWPLNRPPPGESAMTLMFKPYRDYGLISGRSRRKEYWVFVMFCIAVYSGKSPLLS